MMFASLQRRRRGGNDLLIKMKPQLLVVDDNDWNRAMLSQRLARHGFEVETIENGHDALKKIEQGDFDLVLLDVMVPGLNGMEVLKTLRQRYSTSELPIIMATASNASDNVVEALEFGANDYVTKPIDFAVALARVRAQLRQKNAPRSKDSMSPAGPGVVLDGKYLLEEPLGSGTFGVVYKAEHIGLEHPVAIKLLRASLTPEPEAFARFRREGISACRVAHPNAVSVVDLGVSDTGSAYMVMELLEGRSLADELQEKGTLRAVRCLEILRPLCDVLSQIHTAGMVHRDIKPPNIYLHRGRYGEIVKVLDFGIAKLAGEVSTEQQLTTEGIVVGTPAYMAPERFGIEPYNGRADVFSVGVMLYRMLGGRMPFSSRDPLAVATEHMRETPAPLRELNPDVTPAIENVVSRAMSKKMEDRPTAAELPRLFGRALQRRASDR